MKYRIVQTKRHPETKYTFKILNLDLFKNGMPMFQDTIDYITRHVSWFYICTHTGMISHRDSFVIQYSSQVWIIGSHFSHVSSIYVIAPVNFVIEDVCLCTRNSHSSQVKNCIILLTKKYVFTIEPHLSQTSIVRIADFVVDIHVSVYSSYKESLIMLMFKNWLCCCCIVAVVVVVVVVVRTWFCCCCIRHSF